MTAPVHTLHWADFLTISVVIFGPLLAVILATRKQKKSKTPQEMLVGEGRLTYLAVAISMLGAVVNGCTLIGIPSEVYYYGATFTFVALAWIIVVPIAGFIFIPTFHNLKMISAYEYLEKRFNKAVRRIVSITFALTTLYIQGILLYAPLLSLSHASAISIFISCSLFGIVCTTYTVMGGVRMVIWVDVIQMITCSIGLLTMIIVGGVHVGDQFWPRITEGLRVMNIERPDEVFRERHTVVSQIVGQAFIWLPLFASSQVVLQRCFSIRDIKKVKIAMFVTLLGSLIMMILLLFVGLMMFAYYHECDPYTMDWLKHPDHILQFYIFDVLPIPGIPGLVTGSLLLASRGAVAASTNSLTGILLEDFIRPIWSKFSGGKPVSVRAAFIFYRVLAATIGLLTILLSFTGGLYTIPILEIPLVYLGMIGGPLFAIFFLALFFPCVNTLGAFAALLISLPLNMWIGIGGLLYGSEPERLPMNTTGCPVYNETFNYTTSDWTTQPIVTTAIIDTDTSSVFQPMYDLSYSWYGLVGFIVATIVGLLVSFVSNTCMRGRGKQRQVDPDLLYPCTDRCCCCCPMPFQMCCKMMVGIVPTPPGGTPGPDDVEIKPDDFTDPDSKPPEKEGNTISGDNNHYQTDHEKDDDVRNYPEISINYGMDSEEDSVRRRQDIPTITNYTQQDTKL